MHKEKFRKNPSLFGLVRANANGAVKGVKDESGSVESALVLIPLLILFLVTMQIGVAINFRNIDRTFAQSEASERAISGQFISTDRVMEVNPLGTFNTLGILITRKVSSIPILIPFIGTFINRSHRSEVTGIAVLETLS
jgi:predicted transporter